MRKRCLDYHWNRPGKGQLDALDAWETFYGKTHEQAEDLFASHALYYQECLHWMPDEPFRFYLPSYINYLKSDRSVGDSDGASAFIGLMSAKAPELRNQRSVLWEEACSTLRWIARSQERFEAIPEIYGNFGLRVEEILSDLEPGDL